MATTACKKCVYHINDLCKQPSECWGLIHGKDMDYYGCRCPNTKLCLETVVNGLCPVATCPTPMEVH